MAANSSTEGEVETQSSRPFRLFDLPPELRNRIYHLALKEDDFVEITSSRIPPPWLSACKQIRSEALCLWYTSNDFEARIQDCDISLVLAFGTLLDNALGTKATALFQISLLIRGINWNNLLHWCRHIWSGQLQPSPFSEEQQYGSPLLKVIQAAHRIAEVGRKNEWNTCKLQLEALRVVAGLSDSKWLD